MPTLQPTKEQFDAYQSSFRYFNEKLFGSRLPEIILNFSRRAKAYGFFAPERWKTQGDSPVVTHEISLNPMMMERDAKELYSTLVHEMCHLDHHENGEHLSKKGYHNKEWGGLMKAVGLFPSSTGEKGGPETGFRMTHYIVEDGAFDRSFKDMPQEFLLPWKGSLEGATPVTIAKKRSKYHCAACDFNVFSSKDGLSINCGTCNNALLEDEK
jgi:predicted SprT family Zn-dependent metalloprotease